jgi:large subunit ribosomal protein L16
MLSPKRQKYRKQHRNRGSLKGVATRGCFVSFGDFGLKAITKGEISSRQIEAARKTLSRFVKRGGKIWIRVFPQKPITRKAAEVPMGSGKGNVEFYVAAVKPGTVLFEIAGITEKEAREAFERAAQKLPVLCKFTTPPIR